MKQLRGGGFFSFLFLFFLFSFLELKIDFLLLLLLSSFLSGLLFPWVKSFLFFLFFSLLFCNHFVGAGRGLVVVAMKAKTRYLGEFL